MNTDDNLLIIPIKDDLCNSTKITAKWITGDNISVTSFKPVLSTTRDRPSEFNDVFPVNIHHVKKHFIFNEPILRSLISEANSIFIAVQKLKQTSGNSDYLKISRTYRSTIRACIEKLQEKLLRKEKSRNEHDYDDHAYENYIAIFYNIECIWHLCEILYIDPTPSNVIVPQLLEWSRFHFPMYERLAVDYLQFDVEAESNPQFWEVVRGLIVQGSKQIARALLKLHPGYNKIAFQTANEILSTLPVFDAYGGLSLQKFKSQWQYWVNDTNSKIASGVLSSEPELEEIITLTAGNSKAWNNLSKNSTCWYEIFAGYLFYTEPGCKHFELGNFASSWLTRWLRSQDNILSLKFLDNVILNIMRNDMNQVLHDIQNINDNQWIAVHLTDLLYHSGQLEILDENQENIASQLRESLLFDFGSSLMSRDSLWIFGIDYLENCSREGLAAMEVLLSRIPLTNEKLAQKVLSVAQSKNLEKLSFEICRILVSKSLLNQRHGNALEWALRSEDYSLISSLSDMILKNYCKTGRMLCEDVLSNVGPKMLKSPRLIFLVKYHDFHQLFIRKQLDEASALLVNLLASQLTPEYFWPTFLADTLPLLESEQLIISSKETYVIIHYLEQNLIPLIEKQKQVTRKRVETGDTETLTSQFESALYLNPNENAYFFKDTRIENVEELVKTIRIGCAKNLARSLIMENTSFRYIDSNLI